jgi:L-alanine-DL-glutamate epimerase-like enolase superfamily enzyme
MKIAKLEIIKLSQPYGKDQRWKFSGGKVDVWNIVLVRLTAEDGTTGLGEIGDGHFVPEVAESLARFCWRMLADLSVFDTNLLYDRLYKSGHFWGRRGLAIGVISGIETACWDIQGKLLGQPVYRLLGGAYRSRLRAYASGGMEQSDQALADELKRHVDAGFTAVKVRGGYPNPARDEHVMAVARQAVGDTIDVAIDAGQGYVPRPWLIKTALEAVERLAPYRPMWLEEPVRTDDVAGYVEVRRAARFPIAGGENLTGMVEARSLVDHEALDVIQADITHAGGIGETRRIADYAHAHGLAWAPHVFRSGVGFMAHLHLCTAQPNLLVFEYSRQAALRDELVIQMPRFEDGYLYPVDEPGLGVHLPEEVLQEFAYRPGTEQWFAVEGFRE